MRFIVLLAKAMMRAMASIPILAVLYILFYFLFTGVSAVGAQVWAFIGFSLSAAAVCIGVIYSIWAFVVPFKRAVYSLKKKIHLFYFGDTAKFAYERLFEKANEYMKLWRTASGRVNLITILLLPTRIFSGISLYVFGTLFLSIFILLTLPMISLASVKQTDQSRE
ncbi:MAG TPA: hypothetical protein PK854_01680 [Oscillospiraceae bacterium]|nr:hypothetical protein [Oscillospiraceae bacterium]HPS33963.1 hypothetical protein [Oscillospiraceae bacterium]